MGKMLLRSFIILSKILFSLESTMPSVHTKSKFNNGKNKITKKEIKGNPSFWTQKSNSLCKVYICQSSFLPQSNYFNHKMDKVIFMQFCFQAYVPEISTEITTPVMRVWIPMSTYLSRPAETGLSAPPPQTENASLLPTNFPHFVVIVCLVPGTGQSCKACPRSFRRSN